MENGQVHRERPPQSCSFRFENLAWRGRAAWILDDRNLRKNIAVSLHAAPAKNGPESDDEHGSPTQPEGEAITYGNYKISSVLWGGKIARKIPRYFPSKNMEKMVDGG
jgi:hypothetical protein